MTRAGPCYEARYCPRKLAMDLDTPQSSLVEHQLGAHACMHLESFPPRTNPLTTQSLVTPGPPPSANLPERARQRRQGWMAPTRQGLVNQVNEVRADVCEAAGSLALEYPAEAPHECLSALPELCVRQFFG